MPVSKSEITVSASRLGVRRGGPGESAAGTVVDPLTRVNKLIMVCVQYRF